MKHTYKQGILAKNNLIKYYKFFECDFYEIENIIYCNSKDNCGEIAYDIYQNIMLENKESWIEENDIYEE